MHSWIHDSCKDYFIFILYCCYILSFSSHAFRKHLILYYCLDLSFQFVLSFISVYVSNDLHALCCTHVSTSIKTSRFLLQVFSSMFRITLVSHFFLVILLVSCIFNPIVIPFDCVPFACICAYDAWVLVYTICSLTVNFKVIWYVCF